MASDTAAVTASPCSRPSGISVTGTVLETEKVRLQPYERGLEARSRKKHPVVRKKMGKNLFPFLSLRTFVHSNN